jgi:hypothetical protein
MRGQLSAEFLIILAIALAAFSIMMPAIDSVAGISGRTLSLQNAALILDRISSTGERALVSGRLTYAEIRSAADFNISARGKSIVLSSQNESVSRAMPFDFVLDGTVLSRGASRLEFSPYSGGVRISVPDS